MAIILACSSMFCQMINPSTLVGPPLRELSMLPLLLLMTKHLAWKICVKGILTALSTCAAASLAPSYRDVISWERQASGFGTRWDVQHFVAGRGRCPRQFRRPSVSRRLVSGGSYVTEPPLPLLYLRSPSHSPALDPPPTSSGRNRGYLYIDYRTLIRSYM